MIGASACCFRSITCCICGSLESAFIFTEFAVRKYTLHATLQDWRILLDGTGFEEVDRGVMVNTSKVRYIYSDLQQIHFGEEAEGVFCPIARVNIPRFQRYYPKVQIRKSGVL
ncbi:LytTR family transcriptional regulator DNA-binding domain-containing protein [Cohnella laeviribosi]|uniref:LytTR family transcriptional regulator DNA-binding domain-containing protein n=1 Tax=Cohnella laeviribosi TaxID=380174 RepID=UPI0009FD6432|nr:LytTR family transcriptional regulator DNA-binding domain-containing protein [Cohnella laeviribosi]